MCYIVSNGYGVLKYHDSTILCLVHALWLNHCELTSHQWCMKICMTFLAKLGA